MITRTTLDAIFHGTDEEWTEAAAYFESLYERRLAKTIRDGIDRQKRRDTLLLDGEPPRKWQYGIRLREGSIGKMDRYIHRDVTP